MLSSQIYDIEIIRIDPVTDGSNLRALTDVRIEWVELRKCRVIQQVGQRAYVSPPQLETSRKSGSGYYPVAKICDSQRWKMATEMVLDDCRQKGIIT